MASALDALLRRPEQETFWTRFWRSPAKVLASYLYDHRSAPQPAVRNHPVHVLASQPHRHKIVIAGNHELCLDPNFPGETTDKPVDWKSLIYLENTSTTLTLGNGRDLKVFGSPYTPKHGNWAFQYPRTDAAIVWDEVAILEDVDILVTHGPPKAHLDLGHLGCRFLRQALWRMRRRPGLHVFGHIHGGYGREVVLWDAFQWAYEAVMEGEWRWVNLGRLVCLGSMGIVTGWAVGAGQMTVMVNAAVVGAVRDEKRREVICVDV
ncbi:hypothetical protein BDW62DRAFT_212865 [Aspergillus aurantiobrunneus]